jgi:hypothetical protein
MMNTSSDVRASERHSLSQNEADLLLKINQGIPSPIRQRYADLIARRQAETLTDAEYDEMLQLTQQVEAFQARRVAYLAELAQLRQIPLAALADSLGIQEPSHV